jgi:hypothetical protein
MQIKIYVANQEELTLCFSEPSELPAQVVDILKTLENHPKVTLPKVTVSVLNHEDMTSRSLFNNREVK